jgi:hypothetical protein
MASSKHINSMPDCFTKGFAEKSGMPQDRFPVTPQEVDEAEEILANELSALSLEEHEKILFDVHGISLVQDEDPPFLEAKFAELEAELQKIRNKFAYENAKYLNSSYVDDPAFPLMFLQSERFDTKLAAQRLVRHFEIKRELFGNGDILAREVRLSDLTKDDMETLESGFLQVLPTRDAAGRIIIFLAPRHRPEEKSIENLVRVKSSSKERSLMYEWSHPSTSPFPPASRIDLSGTWLLLV